MKLFQIKHLWKGRSGNARSRQRVILSLGDVKVPKSLWAELCRDDRKKACRTGITLARDISVTGNCREGSRADTTEGKNSIKRPSFALIFNFAEKIK